ncbi:MAG: transglycosylase SLT domain-containing protein [Nitrospira sp.]|nr:transglycosylase SLT domain-containing protein [Nitrospira sp.]
MNNHNIGPYVSSNLGRGLAMAVFVGGLLMAYAEDTHAASVVSPESQQADGCGGAEECFAAAVWLKGPLGSTLTREQVVSQKLERFRRVEARFPSSLWAKRAKLLSGVMLIEQNPADAIAYLREAQEDFPILDDYIRFWTGEALLHRGDVKEAARMFESVLQTVPDSNLLTEVTFRAGEAWYRAADCAQAVPWLAKAIDLNKKDATASQAWLWLADCRLQLGQQDAGREVLKKLWVKFPQTKEAQEAEALLVKNGGGGSWTPQPEDFYRRAQVLLGHALHAEAIKELNTFLATNPTPSLRSEAKLKLGVAQVRLKLYDQARDTFQELAGEQTAHSDEAVVWLARVYLRQGLGEKLLALSQSASMRSLSKEQKGKVRLFAGIWLEDETQFDEAIAKYRQVGKFGEPASQRTEAQWREGWVWYRMGRHQEAIAAWQPIVERRDGEWEPQVLYWTARAHGHVGGAKSGDMFRLLCSRYPYTYYCQLAQRQVDIADLTSTGQGNVPEGAGPAGTAPSQVTQSGDSRSEIERQPSYQRAIELKTLGRDQDAARELAVLTERYSRVPQALTALSIKLSEAGAYNNALRLVRTRFQHQLERTGGDLEHGLWHVAYPMGLVPTIKMQQVDGVDPYLVAAIIREESQYDWRAVSRVGAIGLMQIMPATANTVAQRHRLPRVTRDDLFDQETNIRIGVRYIEQLLSQFSGNVVQAVAAYNAGPIVVESWATTNRGWSEDEFVELIPYRETRQYVKRVLRSFKEYMRLAKLGKPVS